MGRGPPPVVAGTGDEAGPDTQPPNASLTAFIRGYLSKKYMKSFIGIHLNVIKATTVCSTMRNKTCGLLTIKRKCADAISRALIFASLNQLLAGILEK